MSAHNDKPTTRRQAKSKRRPSKAGSVDVSSSFMNGQSAASGETAASVAALSLEDDGVDDEGVCFICAELVKFYSLSECNHRTCHVCALRLRALYKKLECTFCKHSQANVLFVASPTKSFGDYNLEDMNFRDTKLSIVFETHEMMEETLILLRFNCPVTDCAFIAKGWADLKLHVKGEHGKVLCDLCIRHKKVFTHEHTLYTPSDLRIHLPSRPDTSSGKEKIDVEGGVHPFCAFCSECFFSDDELYHHLRQRHEECFICKRQDVRDQYFRDYQHLEEHFNAAHHPCTQLSCQAQKFVVFGSLIDLKAHMVEQHGAAMSAKEKKDLRRVETNFILDDRRGPGGRRGDRDDLNMSHASSSSISMDRRRGIFDGRLTSSGSADPGHAARARAQLGGGLSPVLAADNDPEVARRHANFLGRVYNLTNGSMGASTSIQAAIRSFQASESSAKDLINIIYNIVDRDVETTASLISQLVDLLEDENKKTYLLAMLNSFKIEQRQDFPELISGTSDGAYAGVASGRVLNAKNSTQSRRSTAQILDRVAKAASSSQPHLKRSHLTRSLPGPSNPTQGAGPASSTVTYCRNVATASTPSTYRIRSEEPRSTPSGPSPNLSEDAFPSLPTVSSKPKPQRGAKRGNNSVLYVTGGQPPVPRAWDPAVSTDGQNDTTAREPEQDAVETSSKGRKGKKKGKEKVLLFSYGHFPS